ncbi:hypothetical protein J4E93_005684 [Alternaria ventricosa]|uniref:uncharacterized protein n=1 Tax=Alternaria ventricosa TaxID=1187951 RepID=UPI0020C2A4B9|nr:uncharacterized protein J4E93_005684 [Alternaria ventricosa]KAI4644886.1 hypothetical protein J4E93_005684 [Alternaria ventricosa]
MDDEGPKWRLEQASTGRATCSQAACKRSQIKIAKGELRIGTHTLFEPEARWYMAWRHWGCATKHQIAGLKETTGNDPTKAPGYDRLSPESQEQVRLAFEGQPVDKNFKGIREDLAKDAQRYAKEYTDVSFYKVDVAGRACACRGSDCLSKNVKITKGELRLGLSVPFDGEHESMVYKHWQCMSAFDLEEVVRRASEDMFDGRESLSTEFEEVVTETLETGKIVKPPAPDIESRAKPKKAKAQKKKVKEEAEDNAAEAAETKVKAEDPEHELGAQPNVAYPPSPPSETGKAPSTSKAGGVVDAHEPIEDGSTVGVKMEEAGVDNAVKATDAAAVPKPKAKKTRAKKRPIREVDASEDELEYIPKKSRSRSTPFTGTAGLA